MSQTIRDSDLNLLRYIPDNILGHHLQGSKIEGSPSPQTHPFRAILLHTNILQFSQITQYMSKKYPNGLELIVDLVNKYIGILQQCLGITGGDMFKYTTDKLIFCWAAPNTNGDEYVGNLCRVILHQLLKVRDMFARELKYEEVALPVTFSVTVGNFSVVSLGGNQTGMPLEHLYGGQVFQEVLESSGLEFGNMAIVISNAVYEKVKRSFYLEEAVVHSDSEEQVKLPRLFAVKGSKEMLGYVPNVDPLYFKKEVTGGQFENIRERILSYIPPCILPYALSDTEKWGSEIRQATILAINIPLEANSLSTQSEILKLHKIIEQFQRMCKLYNTIIYRIYVDKTGLNCFIAAGLYPQSNSQISIRGVLLGVSIQQALSADNIPVYIGISTGQVIYSICGEYRKDLLLIGEPVYMSYLLSLMALKDRTKQVFVDYETKMQAEGKISFCKYVNTIFAGKVAEGIFEPVYSNEALKGIPGNSFPEIRTHHFNPDYSTNIKKQDYEDSLYMVGREDKLLRGRQFVLQFVKAPVKPNVLLITGSYGVGKTLFVRNLLENIDDMLKEKFKTKNRPSIMVSSLNPANQTKRLNGWRRIMRQVLDGLAQNLGYDRDALLNRLLEREKLSEWNSKHIREILGAPEDIWTPNKANRENIDGTQESDSEDETYPVENDKSIVDMMVRILQYSVGEKTLFRKESDRKGEQEEYLEREKYPPLILCLDDMQDHDKLSWQLLLKVIEKVRRVCIIGVLRQDDSESERPNPLSLNDMSPTFDTQWITTCNDPYLSMDHTRKGNTRKAERERKEMMEDVLLQISTRPNMQFANYDLASLSKTEMEELIRRILEGRQISEELMQIMMERSKGNPLLGVDLLGSYLKQDMLQNMEGEWLPSDALKKFTSLGQYIEAIVPISVYKKSIEIIDSQEITRLSLLKIASAIGTTFDIKTLLLSDLLYHSILPLDALLGALDALVEQKIFKIVDRSTKNIVYKFSSSFLRETIYQLMPYAYRQKQHKIIVASWQGTKNFLEDEQVLYQLALADTSIAFHDQYAENIRRAYVTKNVDTMFSQQTKRGEILFKSGNAEKQSKAGDKWVSRFVVLTSTQLRYYKNQADFNDKPILPSVAIPLKNIITTEKRSIPNTTKTILQIEIAGWIKGPQENGPRSFFFVFEDDQVTEEWLFSLEYLRGRAIYEDFVGNYDPRVSLQQRQPKRTLETLPASQRQPLRTRDWEGQTQEKQTNFKTSPMKTRRTDYENMGTQDTVVYEEMSWTKDRTIRSPYQNRTKTSFTETEKLSPRKRQSPTREQSGKERNIDVLKSFLCKGQVLLWAHTFSQAGVSIRNKEIFGDTPKLLREKDLLKSDLGPEIKKQKEVSILKTEPVFPGVPVNFTMQKREKDLSKDIMQGFKLRVKQVTEKDENSLELSYSPKKEPEGEYLLRSRETWEGDESVQNTVGDVMRYQKQVPGESIEVVKKKAREHDKKGGLSIESMLNKRLAAANVGPKEVVVRDKSGKKNKQLKPSMYGKYEFVSTFFVDSYVDDSVFESQNNGIPNTLKKRLRLTLDNIPHNGSIKILKSQQGGEITVLMEEQSKERTKESSRDKFIKLNNRLETEALAYVGNLAQPLGGLRKDNDFTDNSRWQNTAKPEHTSQAGLSMEHWREGQSLAEKSWLASPIKGRGLEESVLRSPLGKSRGGEERDKRGIRNQGSSESPEIRAIVEEFKNPFKAKKPDMQSNVARTERGKGMELRSGQSTSPIREHTFSGREGNVMMEGSRLSRSPLSIETSNRGKIFPQTQRSKTPTYEPSAYSIQNPMLSSIQKPPQEIQRSSRFGERNEISTSAFPPQVASRDFVNDSPLKPATPFRLEVPSTFRAKNNPPATQSIPQERTSMASPSLHLNSNKPLYFGHTNQTISSVDGDDFTLQPGEFVVITRIFERQGLVELLWSGYTGLFPLNCVNIQKQADPQDVKKHVTIGQVPESQRNSITGSYRMTYSERESIQGDNSPLAGRSIPGSINDVNVEDRINKAYSGSLEEKMKMGMSQRKETGNFGETSAEFGRKMPSKMMVRQMKKNPDKYEPQGEQKRNIFMS